MVKLPNKQGCNMEMTNKLLGFNDPPLCWLTMVFKNELVVAERIVLPLLVDSAADAQRKTGAKVN